jgi:outer membrane protein
MKNLFKILAVLASLLVSFNASAELKVGYVELNQIMQSQPAIDIGKKLQNEFAPRTSQLEQMRKQIEDNKYAMNNGSNKLSETELQAKSKALSDLTIEFERKERELNEDVSLRKNEEMKKFQDSINNIIRKIAQDENIDLILYNGVAFASKKIEITNKVISALK